MVLAVLALVSPPIVTRVRINKAVCPAIEQFVPASFTQRPSWIAQNGSRKNIARTSLSVC